MYIVNLFFFRPNGSLRCAAVDPVVVSDVFADEIIEELIHDIIDETVGNGRCVTELFVWTRKPL